MGNKKRSNLDILKKIESDEKTRAHCQDCFEDIVPLVERMRTLRENVTHAINGQRRVQGPLHPEIKRRKELCPSNHQNHTIC